MSDVSANRRQTLRQEGELALLRGRHPPSRAEASVLFLAPVPRHPSRGTIERLRHEWALAPELDPAWAVQPLALVDDDGREILVLDDPGGEPLECLLDGPMELGRFLAIAVGLAHALAELHAHDLIHKDLKPSNVLVGPGSGEVRLMGFGIASVLPRERQSLHPTDVIAGTLAYMAPEQTGRMNRSVDSRSDLYALGVTLYETVTGAHPFAASDPIDWVHCHVARLPVPPAGHVPATLSAIIMKLLAKSPEDRYQTAAGVEYDLRRCREAWERRGAIDDFPPGEHDTPDRLRIPEKLYGRTREIETLLSAFDRVVRTGTPELVLVSGPPGIGKSSVVHELNRARMPAHARFAAGKFDPYERDTPYATLAQAVQGLVRPLLGKSDAELARWRGALGAALGPYARLLVDLVPELVLLIGEPAPLPELPPQEAQRRFQLLFRRFLGVFARPDHPVVLFLDDLQWLDAGTLDVLADLLTAADVRHVLLIGAYREDEVGAEHPLTRKVETLRQMSAPVLDIVLTPLARDDVARLVASACRMQPESVGDLARLIHEKTGGNPFFVTQFLLALADDGLIALDHANGKWSWDLERIRSREYTDNVVELMVDRLDRLAPATRRAVHLLACLGGAAHIGTLSNVCGRPEEAVRTDLREAVRLDLLASAGQEYRFVHDRVHEAAYVLLPERERALEHLQIGRLLLERTPLEQREQSVFAIVNQLNRAVEFIEATDERERVAELNLVAALRAKATAAYASALTYLIAGAALLPEACWESRHELAFELELSRAECEFLTGAQVDAGERLSRLAARAATAVERARVACLRMDLDLTLQQLDRAIGVGLDYLHHVGTVLPAHPTEDDARREYERVAAQLEARSSEELIALPAMTDPVALATLDVLTRLLPATSLADTNLSCIVTCKAVQLGLERGTDDASSVIYAWCGALAGALFGDYPAGRRLGDVAYELVERRGLRRYEARTCFLLGNNLFPWTEPLRRCRDLLRHAFAVADERGDVVFASYAAAMQSASLFAAGEPLADIERDAESGLAFARKARFGMVEAVMTTQRGLARALRGATSSVGSLADADLDPARFERELAGNPGLAFAECWYWIRTLQAHVFAGDTAAAVVAATRAERWLPLFVGQIETAGHSFHCALAHAAAWDDAPADERQRHAEVLAAQHRRLALWATHGPENFADRAALVEAEIARIEGRELDAERLYEQAIRSAHQGGFVHNEALANEVAARFYRRRGLERPARAYLSEARACYERWGALGKVRQLDELHPEATGDARAPGSDATLAAQLEGLDLTTVISVSHAIARETVLERLLAAVMRTTLQEAGADRAVLMLSQGTGQRIVAEATTSRELDVRLRDDPIDGGELPETIVQHVVRTSESVIVDDARADNAFASDAYVRTGCARSICCLPLVNQARLVGVLYLENRLAPRVFTPTRLVVLDVLASQAAISLENARLYREVAEREERSSRLINANVVGVGIWHTDGRVSEANDALLRMVGYSRQDLIAGAIHWGDLTPPEWRDTDARALAHFARTGSIPPYEKEFLRKDGSRVPVLLGSARLECPDEGVAFVLDLTPQKKAEKALREAQAALTHVSRVATFGEVTGSIAHELNQPLAAILNNAQACISALDERPELEGVCEALRDIVYDAERAAGTIEGVHRLVRGSTAEHVPVHLAEVARDAVAIVVAESGSRHVAIHTDVPADLPAVVGDRVQLQQLLLNLIVNGMDAMANVAVSERRLEIRARAEREGRAVRVSVVDRGVGFPAGDAERLFQAFYTTKPQGMGLGLAISRSIVESHGGRLWAEPNDGPGATVSFTLPAAAT